jgi:peptide/nickel transport system permease protein
MNEPEYGRSYGEIVTRAFRRNTGARVALWGSVLLIVTAILAPLAANDRPFLFKGTLPGDYRKAWLTASRGIVAGLGALPGRLRGEQARFRSGEASLADFLRYASAADASANYAALERLRKRAEGMPEIRGRWAGNEVGLSEIEAELRPAERPAFAASRAGIEARLPAFFAGLLDTQVRNFETQLALLLEQRGLPGSDAAPYVADLKAALGTAYLDSKGERAAAIRAVGERIRADFDPEKILLVPLWRFPLPASLDALDVFFIGLLGFAVLVCGPLTWLRLSRLRPLERRWGVSAVLVLVPSLLLSAAWALVREDRFDSRDYLEGAKDGSIVMESSLWPLIRHRYDRIPKDATEQFQPPSWKHPFGTDAMGRDLFTRMLWGSRISLSIGFSATLIAVFIGVVVGALAGYFGGWVDIVISRFIEIMICFPRLFIILAIVAFLPPNIFYVMLALGLFGWMGIARLQRAEFLRLRSQEFTVAARALGATPARVMFRHILPNGVGPILVTASFGIAGAMLLESSLSFLGLGVQEPATSWGQILQTGRTEVLQQGRNWWTYTFPGAAIFLAVTYYNLVGDGVRDAVDPRLKS